MDKVICCFQMPQRTYIGGVATMVHSYLEKSAIFEQHNIALELFDYRLSGTLEKLPPKMQNIVYGIFQCIHLIKKIRSSSAKAVHIHTSREFLYLKDVWLAREIKRICHVSVYITVHVGAAETVFNRIGFAEKQTIGWINRYVDNIIFLSDGIRKEFVQLGMQPERGVTLGNFHDLTEVSEEENLTAKAKLHILFVGAIHGHKGILELLTALSELPDLDYHLDICGVLTDQSIKSRFEDLTSLLGDRVTLHGYVKGKEKTLLFRRADVLALPSYHEGFPLVILEALAGACAIISTPVGATPEVLGDQNALWVNVGSSDDIESALMKFAEEEALLSRMKRDNLQLSKTYSAESHIQALCHILGK